MSNLFPKIHFVVGFLFIQDDLLNVRARTRGIFFLQLLIDIISSLGIVDIIKVDFRILAHDDTPKDPIIMREHSANSDFSKDFFNFLIF